MSPTQDDLNNRYTYHDPRGDQKERYTVLRETGRQFAELVVAIVPESRERDLALMNLEQATMWANAGIARNE